MSSFVLYTRHRLRRFLRFFGYLLKPRLLGLVLRRSAQHRLLGLSAEIAYNAIFALFPAILAIISAIGLLALPESHFRAITAQLSLVVPDAAMTLIRGFLQTLRSGTTQGLFSLTFLASLWVSSNVLGSTMAALDQIHEIPRRLRRPFWQARLMAIGLSFGTFLLLTIALVIIAIGDVVVRQVAHHSGPMASPLFQIWQLLSLPIAIGIVAFTFGFVYRYGPSHRTKGSPIMPGAMIAALLWVLLSGLLRLYVAHFGNYNQAYGAIGAVIILLLWLYLSGLTMLFGCQLNVVVGKAMQPSPHPKRRRRKRLHRRPHKS
jgi:membrane protein